MLLCESKNKNEEKLKLANRELNKFWLKVMCEIREN